MNVADALLPKRFEDGERIIQQVNMNCSKTSYLILPIKGASTNKGAVCIFGGTILSRGTKIGLISWLGAKNDWLTGSF